MTIKELQKELADSMRRWQKIENSAIVSTGFVMEKTDNPNYSACHGDYSA